MDDGIPCHILSIDTGIGGQRGAKMATGSQCIIAHMYSIYLSSNLDHNNVWEIAFDYIIHLSVRPSAVVSIHL